MTFFTNRNGKKIIKELDLYIRFSAIMEDFEQRDYFKEKLKIHKNSKDSKFINTKSIGQIGFQIYPFNSWSHGNINKGNIFDAIEFLYPFVSKPGEYGALTDHTNWSYGDYLDYDNELGKQEFIDDVNSLLAAFNEGYELDKNGQILFRGDEDINFLDIDFPEYNEENIDSVIHLAIKQWKNKEQSIEEKKQAIIKLANVFEYLKKERTLEKVLNKKDMKDLFQIANDFALRHHNPYQKKEYDMEIWVDWIFQYYLSTCVATLKMIKKNKP